MPLDGSSTLKLSRSPSVSDAEMLPLTGVSSSSIYGYIVAKWVAICISVMSGVSLTGLTPTLP
ncbi:hypothetical protein OK016_00280 [Vibrio chagasii]|nr:hypothetical protein [Vibrio chagasii]